MNQPANLASPPSISSDSRIQAISSESDQLLALLVEIYDLKPLAERLQVLGIKDVNCRGIDRDRLGRWKKKPADNAILLDKSTQNKARQALLPQRPRHFDKPDFTFIDLFAGIGGIRRGFEKIKGKCVFTSEWDDYSRRTYLANHYVEEEDLPYFLHSGEQNPLKNREYMDIQKITLSRDKNASAQKIKKSINKHIPDHDVLLAGFPCQPFSLAGVSKKKSLGRAHGFSCETQGTLFFDVEKIIEIKQPKYFVLENVKNLKGHDQGNTFAVIVRALDKLGYWLADISDCHENIEEAINIVRKRRPEPTIIDACKFIPQHRERIVLVGIRKDLPHEGFSLNKIKLGKKNAKPALKDLLQQKVDKKYTLTPKLWGYLFNYALKHQARGNGFGFGLVSARKSDEITRTLSARYYKDGSEILINQKNMSEKYLKLAKLDPEKNFDPTFKTPRRLTPTECARLMGFEKPMAFRGKSDVDFNIPVSDTRAYKQFGNSVVVPVFEAVAALMKDYIHAEKAKA